MLPQMAGYGTATSNDHTNTGPSNPKHKISPDWSIHVSDTAVDCAWKVLDAIDHENEGEKSGEANNATSDQDTNSCLISLWLPLVVFYSGLTVWARFCEDQSSGNSGIHSYPKASRKVLGLFHRELKHMGRQYECASRMAAVLEKL